MTTKKPFDPSQYKNVAMNYHALIELPPESYLYPELFETVFDDPDKSVDMFNKGLNESKTWFNKRAPVLIGVRGQIVTYGEDPELIFGYHANTSTYLRGLLEGPAAIIVNRKKGESSVEIKPAMVKDTKGLDVYVDGRKQTPGTKYFEKNTFAMTSEAASARIKDWAERHTIRLGKINTDTIHAKHQFAILQKVFQPQQTIDKPKGETTQAGDPDFDCAEFWANRRRKQPISYPPRPIFSDTQVHCYMYAHTGQEQNHLADGLVGRMTEAGSSLLSEILNFVANCRLPTEQRCLALDLLAKTAQTGNLQAWLYDGIRYALTSEKVDLEKRACRYIRLLTGDFRRATMATVEDVLGLDYAQNLRNRMAAEENAS